ncbi:hypothetical protein TNCV_1440541 [Trichonephila clavipes]|nr:hypothetical protein TNCV_1440541 [Trichonephila clavipes]
MSLHLIQPLIYAPGSGGKGPPKVGKLTIGGEQSSDIYTDMTQVTLCPCSPFPPNSLSCHHGDDSGVGGGGETTSVRFFTVTQNWANFSFTLER